MSPKSTFIAFLILSLNDDIFSVILSIKLETDDSDFSEASSTSLEKFLNIDNIENHRTIRLFK